MLCGPSSIYIVCFMVFSLLFGVLIVYFIIFGNICKRIAASTYGNVGFFDDKAFFVLLLGGATLPLALKKELREMKLASITLFIGVILFVFVFGESLIFNVWRP